MSEERPKQEYIDFLLDLQKSGVTNMLGAGPYLQDAFDISRIEAKRITRDWMHNGHKYIKEQNDNRDI